MNILATLELTSWSLQGAPLYKEAQRLGRHERSKRTLELHTFELVRRTLTPCNTAQPEVGGSRFELQAATSVAPRGAATSPSRRPVVEEEWEFEPGLKEGSDKEGISASTSIPHDINQIKSTCMVKRI